MRVTDSPPEPSAADVSAAGTVPSPDSAANVAAAESAPAGPLPGHRLHALGSGESRVRQAELAWLVLAILCLIAVVVFPAWQVFPLDTIWLSLAALYAFVLWPDRRPFLLAAVALVATVAAASDDALRHRGVGVPVRQVPVIAAIFILLAWQANRRMAAQDKAKLYAESQRLVGVQRQFLQDASHQLRTPITIALGHAELVAAAQGSGHESDIRVVVGELQRLKKLSERLLLVAAAENPGFLVREPADVDMIVADLFLRWQAVAPRRWQLGDLDPVTAEVDAERLGLALDALVENAVRHTAPSDEITLSVVRYEYGRSLAIAVTDTGCGISEAELPHVFERFRTSGPRGGHGGGGTGLGLALVRAVAAGHGGDVNVRSVLGAGSTFELVLPTAQEPAANPVFGPAGASSNGAR